LLLCALRAKEIDRQLQAVVLRRVPAAGPGAQEQRRTAANAGSVMLTTEG